MSNNNRISPANIIAIISVAALGVITYLGASFLPEKFGNPIIWAALFTFGIGLFLVFCIATKTVESEFNKWKPVEFICLGVYLVIAVCCYKPFLQFFHVVQHKQSLQTMAKTEIDTIQEFCKRYNNQAEKAVELAASQMNNYNDAGQYDPINDNGLSDYLTKHVTKVSTWQTISKAKVKFNTHEVDSLEVMADRWNVMEISSLAVRLDSLAIKVWSNLDRHIQKYETDTALMLIPVISGGGANGPYRYDGLKSFDLGPKPNASVFTQRFREPVSGFNWGIAVYILLHLLALANYFLIRRSPIIDIQKGNKNDDTGLPLDID